MDECRKIEGDERAACERLDYALRMVLIENHARASDAAHRDWPLAIVTIMMSVTADAAILAAEDRSRVQLEDFLALARNAFEWSAQKGGSAQG